MYKMSIVFKPPKNLRHSVIGFLFCWSLNLLHVESNFYPIGNHAYCKESFVCNYDAQRSFLRRKKYGKTQDVVDCCIISHSKLSRAMNSQDNLDEREKDDRDWNEKGKINKFDESPKEKKLSPLAMAAADWMEEEEEEDELSKYWGNYEKMKNNEKKDDNVSSLSEKITDSNDSKERSNRSTQQLLDDYYGKFGIDKKTERRHKDEIEDALRTARKVSSTTKERINALEKVKPFLQPNTRLGGEALIELATLYCNNDNIEEKYNDDAREILMTVMSVNQDRSMRRRARQLMFESERTVTKSNNGSRFFNFGFNFDSFWS